MSTKTAEKTVLSVEAALGGPLTVTETPKAGVVVPPVTPEYAAHISKELLRVLDVIQPKAEKSYSADFGAQIPAYEAGKPIQRQDMKRSGKTADDVAKFRRMAERFATVCTALAGK